MSSATTHWVVVGAGTAGCVVAARLSADPAQRVTLLEAGGGTDGGRVAGHSSLADLAVPGAVWPGLLAHEPDGSTRPYLQGRGIGGSSRINGSVLTGEGVDALPTAVVGPDELGPVDRALLTAAHDADPVVLARGRDGRLVSAAEPFLTPARQRSNLEVRTNCGVSRVALDRDRVTGVVLGDGSSVAADRVVLCAGAIFTPAILLRSGLVTHGLGDLLDHAARVVDLHLRDGSGVTDVGLVTGAALRRGGAEVIAMNHVGAGAPGRAALLVGCLAAPRRGRVRLDPDDAASVPVVTFDPVDGRVASVLSDGLALAESLLATPAFTDVVAEWSVVSTPGGYYHAVGSCRVGAVVDNLGAVAGAVDLYVADASVIDLPASGTFAPVVANAARLAGAWLGSRSGRPRRT